MSLAAQSPELGRRLLAGTVQFAPGPPEEPSGCGWLALGLLALAAMGAWL
jgi:hypothetical protein